MLRGILWDMDGTLVDSEGIWAQATFAMSTEMGRRLTAAQQRETVGSSFNFTVSLCASNAGIELDSEAKNYWQSFMSQYVTEKFDSSLLPNPGIKEVLDSCRNAEIPMAIATNTIRSIANHSIGAVGIEYFKATVCGDEVANPKPAPDVYLKGAQALGVPPEGCIVFEDSKSGMLGGLAAGCIVISVVDHLNNQPLPEGVVQLSRLHGPADFRGVSAEEIMQWYATLSPNAQ
ncbi:HAD family phosphatase [Corynebacterium diphtheriae]|nr:HAD family phosphatase [Corynebacterium diphtheriae]